MSLKIFFIAAILFAVTTFGQEVKTIKNIDDYQELINNSDSKVILVNFWATWCPPCVKEFPELVKLYKDYKNKGFALYFISLDDKSDYDTKLLPFLKKNEVDFTSYYGDFENPESLMNYVDKNWQGEIPYTGIYNKKGVLVKTLLGSQSYEQFEKEIKKLLDK
ncbi:MAG: redoxin domain-containing protein [Ignavibacteria bacterium]|nr:redoxin domain-containing protein [Ignavibacteria bacterium]